MTSAPSAAPPDATPLTDSAFDQLTDAVLSAIEATVDRWLDTDVVDIDGQRNGGLLQLRLPNGSQIILNTQPPLHELWLAARAGGHHYRYVERAGGAGAGQWLDTRDGTEFFAALSQHASAQTGLALCFAPPAASGPAAT